MGLFITVFTGQLEKDTIFVAKSQLPFPNNELDVARLPSIVHELADDHLRQVLSRRVCR